MVLYSQALRDAVGRFHDVYKASLSQRPALSITFYYASLGDAIDPKVEIRRGVLIDQVREYFTTATISCEYAGAKKLMEWVLPKAPTKTTQAGFHAAYVVWLETLMPRCHSESSMTS